MIVPTVVVVVVMQAYAYCVVGPLHVAACSAASVGVAVPADSVRLVVAMPAAVAAAAVVAELEAVDAATVATAISTATPLTVTVVLLFSPVAASASPPGTSANSTTPAAAAASGFLSASLAVFSAEPVSGSTSAVGHLVVL